MKRLILITTTSWLVTSQAVALDIGFPDVNRTCASTADCIAVEHVTVPCTEGIVLGINKVDNARYEIDESHWRKGLTYPEACPTSEHWTAEDGAEVRCDNSLAECINRKCKATAHCAPPPESSEVSLQAAKRLFRTGKFREALAKLNSYQAQDEAEGQRFFWIGMTLSRLKQYDAAITATKTALKNDPKLLVADYNIACFEALRGQKKRSLAQLEQFLRRLEVEDSVAAADIVKFTEYLESDADLVTLRTESAFETVRASARYAVYLASVKVDKTVAAALAARLQQLDGTPQESVCAGTTFASGRCALAPNGTCPSGFFRVRRVTPLAKVDQCKM